MRFLAQYSFIVDRAPLQLYSSALVFAPENSVVKSIFRDSIPGWIQKLPEVESAWTTLLQTLEGHSDPVYAVAFSSNNRLLASGSSDNTIKIWDINTGALQQTLEGHSGCVLTITFSSDGKLLASSSYDGIVRLCFFISSLLRPRFIYSYISLLTILSLISSNYLYQSFLLVNIIFFTLLDAIINRF